MIKPVKRLIRKLLPHRKELYYQMLFERTSPRQIRSVLEQLAVRRGSVVLVHTSLSSLGYFRPGPAGLIRLLQDVIGPEGTLLMPSFPFSGSMQGYVAQRPQFDIRRTPSKSGALTEVFRTYPGVVRSLHPTHPVCALGAHAEELTEGHENTGSPCGRDSPFGRLADRGAIVLRLGTGALTLYHHVQELVDFPNLFLPQEAELECRNAAGNSVTVRTKVYRERIPQILYIGNAAPPEELSVHPRDFPLLYSGDREAKYRQDSARERSLRKLLEIRAQFESRGLLRKATLKNCRLETFPAREYLEYATREIPPLLEQHSALYELSRLESLLREERYPK